MATRLMYLGLGSFFVGLAALGVLLPLLPTTPFVLLAAACFARSSPRAHNWLLQSRMFGGLIRDWQCQRCVQLRVKLIAVGTILLFGGLSLLRLEQPIAQALCILGLAIGLGVVLTLPLCRQTPPDDSR